jgi:hypothetical protein
MNYYYPVLGWKNGREAAFRARLQEHLVDKYLACLGLSSFITMLEIVL